MFIRFENQTLNSAFVAELDRADVQHTIDKDGAVNFDDAEESAVVTAAHTIRDAQFPWYFLKWPTKSQSLRFRDLLDEAGLPFFVEYHDSGLWFLVRRADQSELDCLSLTVADSDN